MDEYESRWAVDYKPAKAATEGSGAKTVEKKEESSESDYEIDNELDERLKIEEQIYKHIFSSYDLHLICYFL